MWIGLKKFHRCFEYCCQNNESTKSGYFQTSDEKDRLSQKKTDGHICKFDYSNMDEAFSELYLTTCSASAIGIGERASSRFASQMCLAMRRLNSVLRCTDRNSFDALADRN